MGTAGLCRLAGSGTSTQGGTQSPQRDVDASRDVEQWDRHLAAGSQMEQAEPGKEEAAENVPEESLLGTPLSLQTPSPRPHLVRSRSG